jgi:hypothetical protein
MKAVLAVALFVVFLPIMAVGFVGTVTWAAILQGAEYAGTMSRWLRGV